MPNSSNNKPSIVLVHGAFADGSSWRKIIPLLEEDGFTVTAVQIPLKSLADDVAATKRAIDAQAGHVVLVGHSYGGAVITDAAVGNAKVKALVFVSAWIPDAGESLGELMAKYPRTSSSHRNGTRFGWFPLYRSNQIPRSFRPGCPGGRGIGLGGDPKANRCECFWRIGHRCRLEDRSVVVCGLNTRSGNQS